MPHFLDEPFTVRLLTRDDLGAIRLLRELVLSTLSDPDLYVREIDEPALFDRNVNTPEAGQTVGVLSGGALIAYGMVSYPGVKSPHNIGRFLSLPIDMLSVCAVMESAMVHPDYRCCGWQKLLLRVRARLAEDRGKQVYTAVASPVNWITRHNLLEAGYVIAGCAELGNNLRRHVFIRGLYRERSLTRYSREWVEVNPLDFSTQQALLNEGFVATKDLHENRLLYEKFV